MDAKDLLQRAAAVPSEQTVEIAGDKLTVRRVTPQVALSAAAKAKDDGDAWMAELAANSIVEGDERPLANEEGVALIRALPPGDFLAVFQAALLVNGFDRGN